MLVTQILSSMTVTLCLLVDSMVIGRFLGVDSMTAYGLASPILLVFSSYGTMLSAGINVVCGRTVGAKDDEGTNACFSVSVLVSLAVALIGMLLILLFVSPLCTLLGAGSPSPDNPVFGLTRDYLRGFIIGAPAFIAAQIMVPFMQIAGERKRIAVAVAVMTVSDIAFDLLNVFVFHCGIFGMGLASSLSYYLALLVAVPYFFKKNCIFRLKPRSVTRKRLFGLVREGVPTVVNSTAWALMVFLFNKILLHYGGTLAVASYAVVSTVANFCFCFSGGIASVTLLLGAMYYSSGDRASIHSLVKTMCRFALIIETALIGAVLLLAPLLSDLFLDEAAATDMTVRGMRLFALSLIPCALNTGFKNFYQSVERIRFSEVISVLQNLIFPVSTAYLLSRLFGINGSWFCFLVGEALTLITICAVVFIKNKRVSLSAEAFALLPPAFGDASSRAD